MPSETVLIFYEWSSQSLTTNSTFLKRFPRVRGALYSYGIGSSSPHRGIRLKPWALINNTIL